MKQDTVTSLGELNTVKPFIPTIYFMNQPTIDKQHFPL